LKIQRLYHFYAAHRNTALTDKCSRLHGHRYGVAVDVEVTSLTNGVGILFADIDALLAPIMARLDHRTLLHDQDPYTKDHGIADEAYVVPFPTSAEYLALHLLTLCRAALPQCVALHLQETDSSLITVTESDLHEW
jgi:6-pyruvoyl-tetrahydropterin synthase